MASEKHAFIIRGIQQVGETEAYARLDDFFEAYDNTIIFDGFNRKAYFFDNQTLIENGGAMGQNVLIGSYELDQQFHDLQGIAPPPNSQVVTFTKGERTITAVMIPPAIGLSVNTTIKGLSISVDAAFIANILGIPVMDIYNFNNDGTTINFYIGNSYEIPAQAFVGLNVTEFIDTSGKVTKVGDEAFFGCTSLVKCNVGSATIIGYSAFEGCNNATNYVLSSVEVVGDAAFLGNSSLTSLSLPLCLTLASAVFSECVVLNTLDIPIVESVDDIAFNNCVELLPINLPSAISISDNAFGGWGGSAHTLTIPTAMALNTGVVNTQSIGTNIVLI